MLTTKINKDDYDKLKKYFDEYCMIIYNRLYPVTDNNIKLYFQDIVNNSYGSGGVPDFRLDTGYNEVNTNSFEVYGFAFIEDDNLNYLSSMVEFNLKLNSIKNDNIR